MLFDPLSAVALGQLLSVPKAKIDQILKGLHSVLSVPEDDTSPVQLLHLSFRDFLLDQQRCQDDQFWIDEKKAHSTLFEGCLMVMSKTPETTLRSDICSLKKQDTLGSEVDRSLIDQCLPSHVQYACRFWVNHLQRSGTLLHDDDKVHQFLRDHLLHWFEALTLMGKTSEGVLAITSLETYVQVSRLNRLGNSS
jgi:hypothetical protein